MDPLTALSVAGTIVQFADFGTKLFSESYEIYRSTNGTLTTNKDLELITTDLRAVIEKLRKLFHWELVSLSPAVDYDAQNRHEIVERLCDDATTLADEILDKIEGLKVKGKRHRIWKSFRQAVKSGSSKEEIATLTRRLGGLKEALVTRVIYAIWSVVKCQCSVNPYGIFIRPSGPTDTADHPETARNGTKATEVCGEIRASRNQLTSLSSSLARLEAFTADEHRQTREMISKGESMAMRGQACKTILHNLEYPSMTSRYEAVLEAYPKTFEWAFQGSTNERLSWSSLADWLRSGTGVYWIHGKPGSGKSTLMKHILDDPRTRQCLTTWANNPTSGTNDPNPPPLCIASFFFWNSGSAEQKSQTGLLRGLLYQILNAIPELIPKVFPEQYAQAYEELEKPISTRLHSINKKPHGWSLRQLMAAFKGITEETSIPFRLCLIIDGLDEFDGDHEEMARLFKSVAQSPAVKVCLSSRSWQVFKNSFVGYPNLQLQDLTSRDISKYVNGKFDQSEAFQRLSCKNPSSAQLLVQEIVEKAAGVFLWVRIVVQSLIQGINNQDDIAMLQQRLRLLPTELNSLYEHILVKHINPLYKEWMSKAFQLLRTSREVIGQQVSRNKFSLTIADFLFAMEEELDVKSAKALSEKSLLGMCENFAAQLNARCSGLLEVSREGGRGLTYCQVDYMHRTVRDFTETEAWWSQFLSYTAKTDFNSHFSLLRSGVLWMRTLTTHHVIGEHIIRTCTTLLYAYHVNPYAKTRSDQIALLDEIGEQLEELHGKGSVPHGEILRLAVSYSLSGYVEERLQRMEWEEPGLASTAATSLLDLIVPGNERPDTAPPLRDEMRSLLERYSATSQTPN
ncbi:hypothetical protein BDZ45DRAFT_810488 [Acephala macrosclerotiorum]|nr:hypothetical protein BDZ45DRAFT_810488 [Acephala macrosclerotiorum]